MRPIHQLVQAAELGDPFSAGPQHQVIGVAKQDVGATLAHLRRVHALDRTLCADRHEGRCMDRTTWRIDTAKPGTAIFRQQVEGKSLGHGDLQRSEVSP
jgi:hypothetical protein